MGRRHDHRRERESADHEGGRPAATHGSSPAQCAVVDLTRAVDAGDRRIALRTEVHDIYAEMLHAAPYEPGAQIHMRQERLIAGRAELVQRSAPARRGVLNREIL